MGSCQSQCSSLLGRRSSEDELELNSNKNSKENIPDPSGRSSTVFSKTKKDSFQESRDERTHNGKTDSKKNLITDNSHNTKGDKLPEKKKILKKEKVYESYDEIIPENQRNNSPVRKYEDSKEKQDEISLQASSSSINGSLKDDAKKNEKQEKISNNTDKEASKLSKSGGISEQLGNSTAKIQSQKKIATSQKGEYYQNVDQSINSFQGKSLISNVKSDNNNNSNLQNLTPYRATINIFYGTNAGTASELAFDMAAACEEEGFQVRVIHMERFEAFMFASCEVALFFLASSGCMGGPTEDSHQFYLWLNSLNQNEFRVIKCLKYSVFGLYNSDAQKRTSVSPQSSQINPQMQDSTSPNNWNGDNEVDQSLQQNDEDTQGFLLQKALNRKPTKIKSMGKRIDMILGEIGSIRVSDICEVDSSKGDPQVMKLFRIYKEYLIMKLTESFKEKQVASMQALNQFLNFDMSFKTAGQTMALQSQVNYLLLYLLLKRLEIPWQYIQLYCSTFVFVYSNQKQSETQSDLFQQSFNEDLKCFLSSKEQNILRIELFKSERAKEGMVIRTFDNQYGSCQEQSQIEVSGGMLLQDYQLEYQEFMELEIKLTYDQQIQLQAQQQQFQFQFGNVVEIFPQNDTKSIQTMLDYLSLTPETVITSKVKSAGTTGLKNISAIEALTIPTSLTVREFIRDFVDLSAPIQAHELYILSRYVKQENDRVLLVDLCQWKNKDKITKEQSFGGRLSSLINLLQSFEFEKFPIQIIACLDRIIVPRVYFFAGGTNQDKLLLTVRLQNDGLTSRFLAEKEKSVNNDNKEGFIRVRVRFAQREVSKDEEYHRNQSGGNQGMLNNGSGKLQSAYSLMNSSSMKRMNNIFSSINSPSRIRLNEANLRIILIALDEGISAFRGYLEEVSQCKNRLKHDIHLFYGCRQLRVHGNEFLGEKSLKVLHGNRIISTLFVASSPQVLGNTNFMEQTSKPPHKSSSSVVTFLLENQIENLCSLIENIDNQPSNLRILIAGNQLMSQGVLGVIAKAYALSSRMSQFNAFNAILNFETDGIITRITW